jgi:hypothetical protein
MKKVFYILLATTIMAIGADPLSYSAVPKKLNIKKKNPDGSTTIKVTLKPGVTRPYRTTIAFRPHRWLMDNSFSWRENGQTNAILEYPAGNGWIGVGNTGRVVETNASFDRHNKRINW